MKDLQEALNAAGSSIEKANDEFLMGIQKELFGASDKWDRLDQLSPVELEKELDKVAAAGLSPMWDQVMGIGPQEGK